MRGIGNEYVEEVLLTPSALSGEHFVARELTMKIFRYVVYPARIVVLEKKVRERLILYDVCTVCVFISTQNS